jgi:hypothetical protein
MAILLKKATRNFEMNVSTLHGFVNRAKKQVKKAAPRHFGNSLSCRKAIFAPGSPATGGTPGPGNTWNSNHPMPTWAKAKGDKDKTVLFLFDSLAGAC